MTEKRDACAVCGQWEQKMIFAGRDAQWYCEKDYPYYDAKPAGPALGGVTNGRKR